jgi:hypothetical protein
MEVGVPTPTGGGRRVGEARMGVGSEQWDPVEAPIANDLSAATVDSTCVHEEERTRSRTQWRSNERGVSAEVMAPGRWPLVATARAIQTVGLLGSATPTRGGLCSGTADTSAVPRLVQSEWRWLAWCAVAP